MRTSNTLIIRGGLQIGTSSVEGGTPNTLLYQDSSGNLNEIKNFTYTDGDNPLLNYNAVDMDLFIGVTHSDIFGTFSGSGFADLGLTMSIGIVKSVEVGNLVALGNNDNIIVVGSSYINLKAKSVNLNTGYINFVNKSRLIFTDESNIVLEMEDQTDFNISRISDDGNNNGYISLKDTNDTFYICSGYDYKNEQEYSYPYSHYFGKGGNFSSASISRGVIKSHYDTDENNGYLGFFEENPVMQQGDSGKPSENYTITDVVDILKEYGLIKQ